MSFDIPSLQNAANMPSAGSNLDLSRYILTHANVDWSKAAGMNLSGTNAQKSGSPSVLSRIFDVISRPSYAIDEMARQFLEHNTTTTDPNTGEQTPLFPDKAKRSGLQEIGDILHGGLSGLAGTQKTSWSKTLGELNPGTNPVAKYGGGFALDVLTDPTTYIGPGLIKGLFKGGKALLTGAKDVSEGLPEAKGILNVIQGNRKPLPVPSESPALPQAVSRASQQVKIPDVVSPGMPVNPRLSVPKVNIAPAAYGLPTKSLEELPQTATKLNPAQIETLSNAGNRKTAQILSQIYKEKGYSVDARSAEKILASIPKTDFASYIREAKNAPVRAEGLAAQEAQKATSLEKLQAGAKAKLPMVNPSTAGINIQRAGDIIDKISSGESHSLVKPPSTISPANGAARFWADRTAREFEQNVLRQPNQFAKSAEKAPAINNPAQQANLFSRFTTKIAPRLITGAKNPNSAKFATKRFTDAYRMQKVAEDYYRSIGLHPTFWDGSKVALTDVMDELGGPAKMTKEHMTQLITAFKNRNPEKIINPEVRQAIENVRARDAIQSAKWVRLALDQNTQKAQIAEQVLSHPKYNDYVRKLISANKSTMQMATDASPVSINSTQHLLRDILTRNGTLPQMATDAKRTYIQLYSTPGSKVTKWLPVQEAQTKAIETVLGSSPSKLGKALDSGNQAENWFMSRLATWYGNKDLRPGMLNQTMSAMNNAAARAAIWNKVAKTYTPDEIKEAFKTAQGHIPSPSSQRVIDLSAQMQKAMENLFSSTGVTEEAQKASSVALRSGALIKDLNKQLQIVKSDFRFTQAKDIKDFMGNMHNYSENADWLKSWEIHQASDPLDFIMRVETATEQLMHQYSFLDEIGARYGSKLRSSVFSTPVAGRTEIGKNVVGRLDGLYFPKELVPQINKVLDTWNQVYDPKSPLIRFLDRVTRAWKSGVTIYAPSHHIRNFIGDATMSWLAGVNDPRSYTIAGRILHSQRARYDSLQTINDLTDRNALKNVLTRPGDKVLTTKGGVDLTAEQLYIAAHSKGLLSHVNTIEDLIGDPLIKKQILGGRVKNIAHGASELNDHFVRMAHFVNYIGKSTGTDIQKIFSEAAQEVRKWHPDGMDLTKFEREKMKRIFPFYSWTRKAIPLVIESAVTRPGKVIAYPRAMFALQGMSGINAPSMSDPFPQDQLFPNWIKSKGIGPIMGAAGNYGIINPSNPLQDLISQYIGTGNPRDIVGGIGGSLNPLARIPAELMTGQTVQGVSTDQDLNRYVTEQIPLISMLSRFGNIGIAGTTNKGQKQGVGNWPAILNWLTAAGYIPTTQSSIKTAQFEKKKGLQ